MTHQFCSRALSRSWGSHSRQGGVTSALGVNDRGVTHAGESFTPFTPALGEYYTSSTVLPPWSKLLSPTISALKQVRTCFTVPHSGENCFVELSSRSNMLVRASNDVQTGQNSFLDFYWYSNRHAHASNKTCTTVKTAFSDNLRTETSQHVLYSISTVVKIALSIF